MNKKVMLGIGIIFIAAIYVILRIVIPSGEGSKTIELTYKTNGGVPYRWEFEIEDESIVKFVGTKDITPNEYKNLDGGPVYTNYIFEGLKKGKTTVTFRYISIVDNSIEEENTITLKVDENKNISLNVIP